MGYSFTTRVVFLVTAVLLLGMAGLWTGAVMLLATDGGSTG